MPSLLLTHPFHRALCLVLLLLPVLSPPARGIEPTFSPAGMAVPVTPVDPYHPPVASRPSRHGPFRTDPSQGIPRHAYSPFDEMDKPKPYEPRPQDCVPDKILVKVKADFPLSDSARLAALQTRLTQLGIGTLQKAIRQTARPPLTTMAVAPVPESPLELWFEATLSPDTSPLEIAAQLAEDPDLAAAEPDFIRKPLGDLPGSGTDDYFDDQWHLPAARIPEAWAWLDSQGLPAGGDRDIVIAVIDTGVDITHPDLAANIWTNSREIAGNGLDDDGNGFIDDVHGCDVVSNSFNHSGNPMDDHGHGTHVAGIIGAQGMNTIGVVGVAYNAQLMPIKAAQYSGVLATSDIAEAINYAVAQGADIINMSFGGYARSQIEEDALAVAFGQCVLVAAAGNDARVNLPCDGGKDMFPAAYNWVLGVMASGPGSVPALFSNTDCTPHDTHEYELLAPGVDIWSTLPNGQYAAWDGTSMAAPVVSGIAALARTRFADKDVYSSRFIMGQIAGRDLPMVNFADAVDSLTNTPTPELRYLQHWVFDTAEQAEGNDADGIVDAGETVDLAIVIRNHWGKADNVIVTLDAWAEGAFQPDPYVTWITATNDYGAVGSFNWDDNGLIYSPEGEITGVRNPFRLQVSADCPNDHVIPFRATMTCRNGLDAANGTVYSVTNRFSLLVQKGRELPKVISGDLLLDPSALWIVAEPILVMTGVTLRVAPSPHGSVIFLWMGK